jgi:D-alanine-D-alanine ligase
MVMTIGLTYDLRSEYLSMGFTEDETAEFDREDTIEAIESALQTLGHRTERVGNAKQLAAALVEKRRWDLVFNIAEGLHGIGREAQVPALLDLYDIPYTFSDPLVMALTLHKGMTKHVIRDAGVPTADFAVLTSAQETGSISFDPPYFVKPVAEGTGKGVSPDSIVQCRENLPGVCRRLIASYGQPVLVESFLSGREFTTAIIGTDREAACLGTMEVLLLSKAEQGIYSYVNKKLWEDRVKYELVRPEADPVVAQAENVALKAWRVLGCRDAGRVDIRCDEKGAAMFIEVNPLAGIHPTHSDLPIICNLQGIPFVRLIERIVASAARRVREAGR